MKMLKKKDGFTLVELIVVIAILAILAGVAIPAYSGYLKKAKDAAVVTELDAIQTAAQAANATAGAITKIEVTEDGITVTGATADKYNEDFVLYYPNAVAGNTKGAFTFEKVPALEGSSYANGAVWNAADVKDDAGNVTTKAGWTAK